MPHTFNTCQIKADCVLFPATYKSQFVNFVACDSFSQSGSHNEFSNHPMGCCSSSPVYLNVIFALIDYGINDFIWFHLI